MKTVSIACLAPALSDELLSRFKSLIQSQEERSKLRDYLDTLLKCVEAWWNIRESTLETVTAVAQTGPTTGHKVQLQELDNGVIQSLWNTTPWMEEILLMEEEFSSLTDGDVRNMAFHLSWFAKEITLDREPLTVERIV